MIEKELKKMAALIVCLVLTGALVYSAPGSTAIKKPVSLRQALSEINGWKMVGSPPLDAEIVRALELDDYVNESFVRGEEKASLYIGYYLTTKKVGAAHDPLVCFPGQGWTVSEKRGGRFTVGSSGKEIPYSTMTVQKGGEKQLVLYWFQSFDHASADTFTQKITSVWRKMSTRREDNAFVRVTVPLEPGTMDEALRTAVTFANAFYPSLLAYIAAG